MTSIFSPWAIGYVLLIEQVRAMLDNDFLQAQAAPSLGPLSALSRYSGNGRTSRRWRRSSLGGTAGTADAEGQVVLGLGAPTQSQPTPCPKGLTGLRFPAPSRAGATVMAMLAGKAVEVGGAPAQLCPG